MNAALDKTVTAAEKIRDGFGYDFGYQMRWFYEQVNHNAAWDIKVSKQWNDTIATETFPGVGQQVYYNNLLMTPEQLGNYTYGYIGNAVGIPLAMLYGGSWLAVGFPLWGNELYDEFYADHPMIRRGFNAYRR